jgi:hypothetical protein
MRTTTTAAPRPRTQLSGGERSYTTVAFTLALGGHTEMPFRAMDEFDVVGGVCVGVWVCGCVCVWVWGGGGGGEWVTEQLRGCEEVVGMGG